MGTRKVSPVIAHVPTRELSRAGTPCKSFQIYSLLFIYIINRSAVLGAGKVLLGGFRAGFFISFKLGFSVVRKWFSRGEPSAALF